MMHWKGAGGNVLALGVKGIHLSIGGTGDLQATEITENRPEKILKTQEFLDSFVPKIVRIVSGD